MKFKFDGVKSRILPLLFEPLTFDYSGDKAVLLASTLDALCILSVTFDQLRPEYQQLLMKYVKASLESVASDDMPELMKRSAISASILYISLIYFFVGCKV